MHGTSSTAFTHLRRPGLRASRIHFPPHTSLRAPRKAQVAVLVSFSEISNTCTVRSNGNIAGRLCGIAGERMRPFDWNDLRYFLSVAQAGTVSQAARSLGVDHATVIRRVEALEHAMGAKLFERTPRGYYLTANGERLLSSAETMHEEARRIGREMLASNHGMGGVVRISTLEGFGNVFLAGRLPKFAAQYPNLHIELLTLQQIVALSRREA